MKRTTLTLIAALLVLPAVAHAKAGVEFDKAIEAAKPGQPQTLRTFVARAVSRPTGNELRVLKGVRPRVTFTDVPSGRVIRARMSRTGRGGVATGTVTFPDSGPWYASIAVDGEKLLDEGQTFTLAPARAGPGPAHPRPVPADPAPSGGDGGGFPAWLLSFPAAALAALGIWRLRRRPRELGA